MIKRLIIISCCALGGFGIGRWLSPPAEARATERRAVDARITPSPAPVQFPPPEHAGRVPFLDLYRSLRSAKTDEHILYLQSLQKLPAGPERRAALTAFFQCMANISPERAADLIREVGHDDVKQAVLAVLAATPAVDTPIVVKMLLALPDDTDATWRLEMLKSQMFYWAAFDATAAAQFADQYQSIYPDLAASRIIKCLAATDPAAAERWLEQHPALRNRSEVMSDYLDGLFQNDPAKARRYVTEHAADDTVLLSLDSIARLTFLHSADEAVQFINHLPTADARRAALDGIVDTNLELFVNDETSRAALCQGMAEWVAKFSPDEWPGNMSRFLNKWRIVDPEGSVSWIAKLPAPTRSAITGEFVRDMTRNEVRQLLATTAGDFHQDILTAFAARLSTDAEQRKATIDELQLSPEDAAQLTR